MRTRLALALPRAGGRASPIDRVVAWTALPACDRDFGVTAGKYRLPLLRGEIDTAVDRYRTLEASFQKDLDQWLANIYVEVRKRSHQRWCCRCPALRARS